MSENSDLDRIDSFVTASNRGRQFWYKYRTIIIVSLCLAALIIIQISSMLKNIENERLIIDAQRMEIKQKEIEISKEKTDIANEYYRVFLLAASSRISTRTMSSDREDYATLSLLEQYSAKDAPTPRIGKLIKQSLLTFESDLRRRLGGLELDARPATQSQGAGASAVKCIDTTAISTASLDEIMGNSGGLSVGLIRRTKDNSAGQWAAVARKSDGAEMKIDASYSGLNASLGTLTGLVCLSSDANWLLVWSNEESQPYLLRLSWLPDGDSIRVVANEFRQFLDKASSLLWQPKRNDFVVAKDMFQAMKAAATEKSLSFQADGSVALFSFPWKEGKEITLRTRISAATPEETTREEDLQRIRQPDAVQSNYTNCSNDPANPEGGKICVIGKSSNYEPGRIIYIYVQYDDQCNKDLYCFNRVAFSFEDPTTTKGAVPRLQIDSRIGLISRVAVDPDQILLMSKDGKVIWKYAHGFSRLKRAIEDRWKSGATDNTKDAEWSDPCTDIGCEKTKFPKELQKP